MEYDKKLFITPEQIVSINHISKIGASLEQADKKYDDCIQKYLHPLNIQSHYEFMYSKLKQLPSILIYKNQKLWVLDSYSGKYISFKLLSPFLDILGLPTNKEHRVKINELYNALLNYKRIQFKYHQMFHKDNDNKYNIMAQSLDRICNIIGWPDELKNLDNFIRINGNLYYCNRSDCQLMFPEQLKHYWTRKSWEISDTDCVKIWNILKRYTTNHNNINLHNPLYIYSLEPEKIYMEFKYVVRNKKWNLSLYNSTCNKLRIALPALDIKPNIINRKNIYNWIRLFCNEKISNLLFWSKYTYDYFNRSRKNNIYIIYCENKEIIENIMGFLNAVFLAPNYITDLEETDNIQILIDNPNDLGSIAISYFNNSKALTQRVIKLASGRSLDISTTLKNININYQNHLPIMIFCQKDCDIDNLTSCFKSEDLNIHELNWDIPSLTKIDLGHVEIGYIQWLLFLAKMNIKNSGSPKRPTSENVLKEFLTVFCSITNDTVKGLPSKEFYDTWIIDYYHQNQCKPIGYKKFNRYLKEYEDGEIIVKPLHKSKGSNVQHIFCMEFLEDKYNTYKEAQNKSQQRKKEMFDHKISELLEFTETQINLIYHEAELVIMKLPQ